jgi:YHS domain-containing protein
MTRSALALILILVFAIASVNGSAQARKAERPDKYRDPVCGMMVDKDPKLSMSYKGESYFFCSRADMDEFRKAPDKYKKL